MKRTLVGLLPLLFCICFRVIAIAQASSDPMKAWIELELHDKDAKIRALFFNATNQTQTLSYSLQVSRTGKNGIAKNNQSGEFTALPDETKTLSKSSFYLSSQTHYEVKLKVYDELELILSDSLIYDTTPQQIQPVVQSPQKKGAKVLEEKKVESKHREVQKVEKPIVKQSQTEKPKEKPVVTISKPPVSPNKPVVKRSFDNLEIDGLIIDETRTKIGRDFYDLFYTKWIAPQKASSFSILIKELPSRGRGARVSILVNEQEVVQRFVPPNYETIELVVNNSIGRVRRHLQKNENLKKQLLKEDQSGSGIF